MDIIWIPVGLVLLALGTYAVAYLFGGRKQDHVRDAKNQVADVRAAAEAALVAELQAIEDERAELDEIKAIEDAGERLKALAAYANRKRKRGNK